MLSVVGVVGGLLLSLAGAQPESEPGIVPAPDEPAAEEEPIAEPDPPDPDEDDDEALEFSASSSSNPPPRPNSSIEEEDGGIRPFKGRFGLGVIRTIAGLNGINLRYFITDKFAIGANVGVALFTYLENDPTSTDVCPGPDCEFENRRTVAAIASSIEALYYAKLGRKAGRLPFRADFGLGGRFGFMSVINNQDVPDDLDDATELHVELPFIVQLMFGENFALAPEFGIDFRIVPGNREDPGDSNPGTGQATQIFGGASNGPGFGFEITPGIGLFGGASMHYYF